MAALLDADKTDCRRYMGFPIFGNQLSPGFGYRYDQQYLIVEYRMDNLSDDEYTQITINYLPNLRILEQDIFTVRNNSDTSQAAVWYRNKLELAERVQNYNWWRQQLGQFFGIVPLNMPGTAIRVMI
jgi:hypothetical protein